MPMTGLQTSCVTKSCLCVHVLNSNLRVILFLEYSKRRSNNTSLTPKCVGIHRSKPANKGIDSSPIARRGACLFVFFLSASSSTSQTNPDFTSLSCPVSPFTRCDVSISADRSWSRYKPVSTAESFDPGVNADCIHSHFRQSQWKRGLSKTYWLEGFLIYLIVY